MGIAVVVFQEVYDGVDDLVRFLRRRSVIKVNDLMSIMGLVKMGKSLRTFSMAITFLAAELHLFAYSLERFIF